jgi:hypothetical protein
MLNGVDRFHCLLTIAGEEVRVYERTVAGLSAQAGLISVTAQVDIKTATCFMRQARDVLAFGQYEHI